jgi:hypothetical protein
VSRVKGLVGSVTVCAATHAGSQHGLGQLEAATFVPCVLHSVDILPAVLAVCALQLHTHTAPVPGYSPTASSLWQAPTQLRTATPTTRCFIPTPLHPQGSGSVENLPPAAGVARPGLLAAVPLPPDGSGAHQARLQPHAVGGWARGRCTAAGVAARADWLPPCGCRCVCVVG